VVSSFRAVCPACCAEYPAEPGIYRCHCHHNLTIAFELGRDVRKSLEALTGKLGTQSMWRYAPVLPAAAGFGSHLAVGWTPLIDIGMIRGARFYLKDETRNPSGSIKDRATEVALAVAAERGIRQVVTASTGNAAASLACIGAAMNFDVTILVPERASTGKLAQMVAHGARVYRVRGTYDDAYDLSCELTQKNGIYNRNTGFNPFTREGKKTCGFEIAEQLGWRVPDWVVVATGDGNVLSGLWKGFDELHELGLIRATPRLAAAVSGNFNAMARLLRGETAATAAGSTIAEGIAVMRPRDAAAAMRAIRMSGGCVVELDDREISAATEALARSFGCRVEPSAGASFAAALQLAQSGVIDAGEEVVVVLTGGGLKDLGPAPANTEAVPAIDPGQWRKILGA
jgi:threonine synthase